MAILFLMIAGVFLLLAYREDKVKRDRQAAEAVADRMLGITWGGWTFPHDWENEDR